MPIQDEYFRLNLDEPSWSAFLKSVTEPDHYDESCAWLFMEKAFRTDHKIFLRSVKNIGWKGEPRNTFAPDTKEFRAMKRDARLHLWTLIGNVHTHILDTFELGNIIRRPDPALVNYRNPLDYYSEPSKVDISAGKRYRDIIRGIVTIIYPFTGERGLITTIRFHDQYGKTLYLKKLPAHHDWRTIAEGGILRYWEGKKNE